MGRNGLAAWWEELVQMDFEKAINRAGRGYGPIPEGPHQLMGLPGKTTQGWSPCSVMG